MSRLPDTPMDLDIDGDDDRITLRLDGERVVIDLGAAIREMLGRMARESEGCPWIEIVDRASHVLDQFYDDEPPVGLPN